MSSDHQFEMRADEFMESILGLLDALDPDELDSQLAMGVLTMEFEDGSKCIMNRQVAAHQIWLAAEASAWHFDYDKAANDWLDTKGRGSLKAVLSEVLSGKLNRSVKV